MQYLKKAVAILLMAVYLLTTTELHQLVKVPFVFEHYAEHHQQDHNITFLQFLGMHYLHGSPHDADYDKDMKLPFKTVDNCQVSYSPASIPPAIVIAPEPVAAVDAPVAQHVMHDQFLHSLYLSSIWQPPRIA